MTEEEIARLNENVTHIRNQGDLVSKSGFSFGKVVSYKTDTLKKHGLDVFKNPTWKEVEDVVTTGEAVKTVGKRLIIRAIAGGVVGALDDGDDVDGKPRDEVVDDFTANATILTPSAPSAANVPSVPTVADSPHLETSDYKIEEVETVHNVDELIVKTVNLCELAYEPEIGIEEGYYFLDSDQDILFHKRESRMYITFRGMLEGSVDFLIDEVGSESSQMLADFDLFDEILNGDRSELQAHAGIIEYVERKYYAIRQELRTSFYHSIESVILCGDGVGGASADFFYYIYAHDIRQARKVRVEKWVTYGAPRFILTPELYYTDKTQDLLRVYNKEDILPFLLLNRPVDDSLIPDGFQHVGTQMCLDGEETDHNANRFIARIIRSSSEIVSALFDVQAFAFIMSPAFCLVSSY